MGTHLHVHAASSDTIIGRVRALANPGADIASCKAGMSGDPVDTGERVLLDPGDWFAVTNCLVEGNAVWIFWRDEKGRLCEDWKSWVLVVYGKGLRFCLMHRTDKRRVEIDLFTRTPIPNQPPPTLP